MSGDLIYQLEFDRKIDELKTRARLYRHIKSGARLLSLDNEDENKVFGITFRTPPPDSTGLPHIMEHSVLCGSRKYPVKEPFVELMKGSLNTFLNAFTFPDKTCYPVASQNLKDFYNLIDVYLDAVFYPRLSSQTLQQEGWHYELDSPQGELSYKGVVFNEMKGVYSSPDSLLDTKSQLLLYPDHPYGLESGGDPPSIPDLTYSQFKAFHQTYYHPSNAFIYFYGDDDPAERLRLVDVYLKDFDKIQVGSGIPLLERFPEPRRYEVPYDAGAEHDGNKALVTVNWLLPETADAVTVLSWSILEHILVATPASPLRKALIEARLGEDLAGRGLESSLRQMYFSTGLKGFAVEQADRVEDLILETLGKLAREGIDPEMVIAALNTVEFRLRENNTGNFPRGLSLMLRALTTWLYDGDPTALLAYDAPLGAIRRRIESGEQLFEAMIEEHLLANPHRARVLLTPDPQAGERREQAEKARLAERRTGMSAAQVEKIVEQTGELKRMQQTPDAPEALATIPTLERSDLDRENKLIPIQVGEEQGCKLLYHDLFTNGIAYLDVGFDLHSLPQERLPYAALIGRAWLEMGTDQEDFVRLSQRIGKHTGGIRHALLTSAVRDSGSGAVWLLLRGKAMLPQAGELLAILEDVLMGVNLDNQERFRQIVLEEKANLEASLLPAGHRMVNLRVRAHFNEADWANEQMSGLSYLFFLRDLAAQVEKDWPAVLETLESIRHTLVNRQNMLCNLTLDAEGWKSFQPQLSAFLSSLPAGPLAPASWTPNSLPPREGLTLPAQVNYVAKGADLYKLGYKLHGSVGVIVNYLRSTWLWEKVRVQGGAYGGLCAFDHRSGVFSFLSYRDPQLAATLENYDQTGGFLRQLNEGRLSPDELTRSTIGAIGDMDAYQLPDARGYTSLLRYLVGDTDHRRQLYRDQLLAASPEDFRTFGEVVEQVREAGRVAVLGSKEAIEAANQAGPGWLEMRSVQ